MFDREKSVLIDTYLNRHQQQDDQLLTSFRFYLFPFIPSKSLEILIDQSHPP